MLGIWEYFWDILDWGVASAPGSIKITTAVFGDIHSSQSQMSDIKVETSEF